MAKKSLKRNGVPKEMSLYIVHADMVFRASRKWIDADLPQPLGGVE